jgi:glucokinase
MIAGIDIGGTSTKIGLVQGGQVIATVRIPTTGHADEHAYADALAASVAELARQHAAKPEAIGIGAPNANQHSGLIELAPNLPWKHDVPLARMMEIRTGMRDRCWAMTRTPPRWASGVTAPAWVAGTCLMVTLGTGVGSGFIVNGQLILGSHGNAGELGHMTLVMDGRDCTCGRKGCLEAYVSIRGLRQTYTELDGDPAVLEEPGVRCIARAAENGDAAALQTFRHAARWLAVGLANAVTVTGPERIILFGGIARNGELLLAPLRERFKAALLNIYHGRVDLVTSALPDDDAAILGAAALTTL